MLSAPAVLILYAHNQQKSQSCEQSKFSTAVLIVKTKDIMLASQALLILCVQNQKISTPLHSKRISTAVHNKKYSKKYQHSCAIRKGQKAVLAAQVVLVLCLHGPKISTAVLIVQATTCAGCSSLASFARTPDKNQHSCGKKQHKRAGHAGRFLHLCPQHHQICQRGPGTVLLKKLMNCFWMGQHLQHLPLQPNRSATRGVTFWPRTVGPQTLSRGSGTKMRPKLFAAKPAILALRVYSFSSATF